MSIRHYSLAAAVVVTSVLGADPGLVQAAEPASPHVLLRITTPQGETYRVGVRPGGLAIVENQETGEVLGLRPRMRDAQGAEMELDVFRLGDVQSEPGPGSRERVLRTSLGFPEIVILDSVFEVEVESIWSVQRPARSLRQRGRPVQDPIFSSQCCVTCGSSRVCGCAVAGSCGSCCSGCCPV